MTNSQDLPNSNSSEHSSEREYIDITVSLPKKLIERFDELKEQWGLQRRGAVLERLLELVLCDDEELEKNSEEGKA